jgi:hypothetical protein
MTQGHVTLSEPIAGWYTEEIDQFYNYPTCHAPQQHDYWKWTTLYSTKQSNPGRNWEKAIIERHSFPGTGKNLRWWARHCNELETHPARVCARTEIVRSDVRKSNQRCILKCSSGSQMSKLIFERGHHEGNKLPARTVQTTNNKINIVSYTCTSVLRWLTYT